MIHPLLVANVLVLAIALIGLAMLTLPPRQTLRARNAFLLRRGRPEDFAWTPPAVPPDFRVEQSRAPPGIEAAVHAAGVCETDGDWQRARALVGMLVAHAQHEGGIQADLTTTFQGIVAGYGYCADYVRVYLAAARSAGLFCRQWAFSFDGFGGHGHTFVEIFDRQRSAWAFVDVHNNVYAVLAGVDAPMDALALRRALLGSPSAIEFRPAAPGRLGFPHFDKLLDYYRRGAAQWYLWWGNDVISREHTGIVQAVGRLSGRLAYRVGAALGQLPPLVVLATPDNEQDIVRMEQLRRRVLWAAIACGILVALLCVQGAVQAFASRHA
jgi:hypothetical protein